MKISKFIIPLVFLFLSSTSFSSEIRHEITGGFNLGGLLGGGATSSLDVGDGGTVFALSGSYFYSINELVSIGPTIGIYSFGGVTIFSLLAGPRLNFLEDLPNGLYVSPSIGFITADAGVGSDTDIALNAVVGKRFQLAQGVSYSPNAGIYFVGSNVRFRMQFLSFSILL